MDLPLILMLLLLSLLGKGVQGTTYTIRSTTTMAVTDCDCTDEIKPYGPSASRSLRTITTTFSSVFTGSTTSLPPVVPESESSVPLPVPSSGISVTTTLSDGQVSTSLIPAPSTTPGMPEISTASPPAPSSGISVSTTLSDNGPSTSLVPPPSTTPGVPEVSTAPPPSPSSTGITISSTLPSPEASTSPLPASTTTYGVPEISTQVTSDTASTPGTIPSTSSATGGSFGSSASGTTPTSPAGIPPSTISGTSSIPSGDSSTASSTGTSSTAGIPSSTISGTSSVAGDGSSTAGSTATSSSDGIPPSTIPTNTSASTTGVTSSSSPLASGPSESPQTASSQTDATFFSDTTLANGETSFIPLAVSTSWSASVVIDGGETTWIPIPFTSTTAAGKTIFTLSTLPNGEPSFVPVQPEASPADTTSFSDTTLANGETSFVPLPLSTSWSASIVDGGETTWLPIPLSGTTPPDDTIFTLSTLPSGDQSFVPLQPEISSTGTMFFSDTTLPNGETSFVPLTVSTSWSASIVDDEETTWVPIPLTSTTSPGETIFTMSTLPNGDQSFVPLQPETSSTSNLPPGITGTVPSTTSSSTSSVPASPGMITTSLIPWTSIVPSLTTVDGMTILGDPLPTPSFTPPINWVDDWITVFLDEEDDIFPIIEGIINHTEDDDKGSEIKIHFENLISSITGILPKLPPIPKVPKPPGGNRCTHSLFDLLGCLVNSLTKITGIIVPPPFTDNTRIQIKIEFEELEKLTKWLREKAYENQDAPTTSSSSSSESCRQISTSQAEFVTCSPSPVISGTFTSTTQVCETSTSTVSGCSIAVTGSSTTLSSSSATVDYCSAECAACKIESVPTQGPVASPDVNARSLQRRAFDDPANYISNNVDWPHGYEGWMLDHAWNPASGTRLIRHVPGKSSAEVITFDPAAPQFSVMERHLFGCTTIVVVSRLGVYMAHLWEVPAFLSPDRGFTPPSFDTDVMEQVPNGDPGRTTMPSLLGLRGEGQILSPDEEWNTVHSFIITPRYENAQKHYGDGYIYKDLVSRIEAGMREWMPDSELKVVSYPQDPENADFHLEKAGKTARGKVLVQYDPKNYFEIQTERGPDGKRCIEWWSRVRMYVGTQSQTEFDDDWPMPEAGDSGQIPRQRQDSNGTRTCELPPPIPCSAECAACEDMAPPIADRMVESRQVNTGALMRRTLDSPSRYPGQDVNDAEGNFAYKLQSGFDGYMLAHYYQQRPTDMVWHYDINGYGLASSKVKIFTNKQPYNMMVYGLTGCTSVVVLSRLGAYSSHLWESHGFMGDSEGGENFQIEVLDATWEGGRGRDNMPALKDQIGEKMRPFESKDAADWAGLVEGNQVRTFIVTPAWDEDPNHFEGDLRWTELVEKLRVSLEGWIPGSQPSIVPYPQDPYYTQEEMMEVIASQKASGRGKLLIQYDPKERVDSPEGGKGCGVQKSRLRFYVGHNPAAIYDEVWPSPTTGPFAEGGKDAGGKFRQLQDANGTSSCLLVPSTSAPSIVSTSSAPSTLSTVPSSSTTSPAPSESSQTSTSAPTTTSSLSFSSQSFSFAPSTASSVSFSSMSFSFAPTTLPTSLTSCDVRTLPFTISDGVVKEAKTYCNCDDDRPVSLKSTTALNGDTLSICILGSAEYTATTIKPLQASSTESPEPSEPPPPPTPAYEPGVCKVHIFQAAETPSQGFVGAMEVSDNAGTVLWTSGYTKLTFDDIFSAPPEDTKLPWSIDVILFQNFDSLDANVLLPPPPPPPNWWQSYYDVGLTAGLSRWNSGQDDESSVPYCKVGGWDNGNFDEFVADLFGFKDQVPNRQMDCLFAC